MNCLDFKCDINIEDNPLNLDINDFLEVGVRNNLKRRFLFISKPLGKHLACDPKKMDELGKLIVDVYNKKNIKEKNGVVISFAETGTAIGHSVFNYLDGDYEFIHTTREIVEGYKSLDFLEEHSHATDHKLYFEKLNNLQDGDEVLLVDDEITTANTCMNIIKKIQSLYPKKRYTICSILNWVEEDNIKKIKELEKELNCIIDFVYLFKGNFNFELNKLETTENEIKIENYKEDVEVNYINLDMEDYIGTKQYLKYSGRFGMNKSDQNKLINLVKRESNRLEVEDNQENVLVLGTEEFMYIPMLFAKEIKANVHYHSVSRSPIIDIDEENYPINSKFKLKSFYNSDVVNYVYNIDKNNYKECFLFIELKNDEKAFKDIIKIFKYSGIKKINIVCFK